MAYVELETIDAMTEALGLSGAELYGQSITVQPSQMEKNVQWTLQKVIFVAYCLYCLCFICYIVMRL